MEYEGGANCSVASFNTAGLGFVLDISYFIYIEKMFKN